MLVWGAILPERNNEKAICRNVQKTRSNLDILDEWLPSQKSLADTSTNSLKLMHWFVYLSVEHGEKKHHETWGVYSIASFRPCSLRIDSRRCDQGSTNKNTGNVMAPRWPYLQTGRSGRGSPCIHISTCYPKHPLENGCLSWISLRNYMTNGCFTKHLLR